MKKANRLPEKGIVAPLIFVITAVIMLVAIISITNTANRAGPTADMRIVPKEQVIRPNQRFEVSLVVESSLPVNVFSGQLSFNPDVLVVEQINYNTGVADLWAEEPWYSNGEGTVNFGGGTTQSGGFTGTEELLTITFRSLKEGEGIISLTEPQILRYDGLGTPSELVPPIDAIITINNDDALNLVSRENSDIRFIIAEKIPSTDLNEDGQQTIADVSVFIIGMLTYDRRLDFNLDGKVDTRDLSIILNAR